MTRRRRLWLILAAVLVSVLVLAAALLLGTGLALRSPQGSARLLSWIPGLTVIEPKGALWGDFGARRVELELHNRSDRKSVV